MRRNTGGNGRYTKLLNRLNSRFETLLLCKKELKGLNCFKSIGPDNIHPKLLRSLADDSSFIFALAKLFCVIDTGKLPNIWKSANLTALFKKGSKTHPLNYIPVLLMCIIC